MHAPDRRRQVRVPGPAADEGPASTLRTQQDALAAHVRDPEANPPPPGVDARRAAVYRSLFFRNIHGLLSTGFPVIARTLGEDAWTALVQAFWRDWRCTTPLFPELPREFVAYLREREAAGDAPAPWLAELAHHEWVELALALADGDPAAVPHDADGDLLDGIPVPSPLAWALAYTWPVHTIAPGRVPSGPPAMPTCLIARRGDDGRVRFDVVDVATFRLLQRFAEVRDTGRAHLYALAAEAGADPAAFVAAARPLLERLRASGVLLGTEPD